VRGGEHFFVVLEFHKTEMDNDDLHNKEEDSQQSFWASTYDPVSTKTWNIHRSEIPKTEGENSDGNSISVTEIFHIFFGEILPSRGERCTFYSMKIPAHQSKCLQNRTFVQKYVSVIQIVSDPCARLGRGS
jgi:hypothetical protein